MVVEPLKEMHQLGSKQKLTATYQEVLGHIYVQNEASLPTHKIARATEKYCCLLSLARGDAHAAGSSRSPVH